MASTQAPLARRLGRYAVAQMRRDGKGLWLAGAEGSSLVLGRLDAAEGGAQESAPTRVDVDPEGKIRPAATDLGVLRDGSVLVAGSLDLSALRASDGGRRGRLARPSMVAKFRPDGSPDSSFGRDGVVYLELNPSQELHQAAQGMAVDRSGRVHVFAKLCSPATAEGRPGCARVIARLDARGEIDRTFGSGTGYMSLPGRPIAARREVRSRMIALEDGLLVLETGHEPAGRVGVAPEATLWKIRDDGSLDTAFGGGGSVSFHGVAPARSEAVDFAVDPEGGIHVLVARVSGAAAERSLTIERLDPHGGALSRLEVPRVVRVEMEGVAGGCAFSLDVAALLDLRRSNPSAPVAFTVRGERYLLAGVGRFGDIGEDACHELAQSGAEGPSAPLALIEFPGEERQARAVLVPEELPGAEADPYWRLQALEAQGSLEGIFVRSIGAGSAQGSFVPLKGSFVPLKD